MLFRSLYMGNYRDRIIATELDALMGQARIVAGAVAENAVVIDDNDQSILSPLLGRMMVRRMGETTGVRTRLFSASETLLADSRNLLADVKNDNDDTTDGAAPSGWAAHAISAFFDVFDVIHEHRVYPTYEEQSLQNASQYEIGRAHV